MGTPRNSKRIKTKGNRAYGLSYALSAIRANPFRALSLALTLSLGISLFASTMVWGDTGIYVSIYGYLEDSSYQIKVDSEVNVPQAVAEAELYMQQSPFVEETRRMNSTVGLVWGTNISDSWHYDIEDTVYSHGVKDCRVIFVDNEFLNETAFEFNYEGSFELGPDEIIVSRMFIHYVEQVFNVSLAINDTIDVELLTGAWSGTGAAPLSMLGRLSVTDLKIVGIFRVRSQDTIIERAFPSLGNGRENWDHTNLRYQVMGIRDSILMRPDQIPGDALSPNGFFRETMLVRVSAGALALDGPKNVASNLFELTIRTKELYNITWSGQDKIHEIQDVVNTYVATLDLSILALPIILLALFFSVFAADTFMAPRHVEVGVIRSKGASYSQVSSVFLWESAVIAALSVGLGILFSVLFAPLIPSTNSFMNFDWNTYLFYLSNTVVSLNTIVRAIGLTVLPSLLFILYLARRAASTEISLTLAEVTEDATEQSEAHGFTIGASIFLLGLVIVMMYILPRHPILFLMELGMGTAAWFFIAYNGSRISRVGLSKVSEKLSFILGQKNLISAGYLKMRKGRIIPLMVVLALTMSSTIAFAVQSESLRVDLNREVSYAIGADLRVDCSIQEFNFSMDLEAYDGVNDAMPVLRTWARLGPDILSIEALYPLQYSNMGKFDRSSFGGVSPEIILSDLAAVPNGIILSEYHAERWNKTAGDSLTLEMSGVGATQLVTFEVVGIVFSAPGFGYASHTDVPPSPLGAGFGFSSKFDGFALTNLEFIESVIDVHESTLFLASLDDSTNHTRLLEELSEIPGITPNTPEEFDLKARSLRTALFLNTIEGLFSIGFVMSLTLSVFALSISLGSVVRERRKEYAVMRAIGGSQRQVVSMVFSEFSGVVIASLALSLVLGAVFGFVMGFLVNVMSPFSRTLSASIAFPMDFLSIVLFVEIMTMIIGAYLPAREASRTDPAVVLRNM
ncbi:MAG: FtsX-like permease family protein [Candidatus Thorarchaeota archaeon]